MRKYKHTCSVCGTKLLPPSHHAAAVRKCWTCHRAAYPPLLQSILDAGYSADECWPWPGAVDRQGYGKATLNMKQTTAHRVVYQRLVGPIPAGLQLDHLCRNPPCVNPAHLEPVTAWENTLRSPIAPSALNSKKTHCKHGHEFTEENTYRYKTFRYCRTCSRLSRARARARLRETEAA